MLHWKRRIERVFESAYEISFDGDSNIVIMSDCHRGNGSWADSFANNRNIYAAALKSYNESKATYIELGDGDELWENKRLSDIYSTYEDIFSLIYEFHKDGRLYVAPGNHDIEKQKLLSAQNYRGKDLKLFEDIKTYEGLILKYKGAREGIFLLHGHQVDFLNGPAWRLSKFLVRRLWKPLEIIGVNDPTSASKNRRRKNLVEKRLTYWSGTEKQILIAGHTHRPVFPMPGGTLYFNDGSCVSRNFITAIEITNGSISLVRWTYRTKTDGTVYVGRDVLAGPRKLKDYFDCLKTEENALKS